MSLPERVGVYGGGRMGAGIAHACLVAGVEVVLVEIADDQASAARDRVVSTLDKATERGALEGTPASVLERLKVVTQAESLAECCLVVEAVPEDPGLKSRILRTMERVCPGGWLATNTSSLSVDGLADSLDDPTRLIGLHFFNPVPASDLVEIVVGRRTDLDLVTASQGWVTALGMTPITVTDSPGFASSRLGVALALEAMRMVQEGVASAADIDNVLQLGYRHPMGPLRTTDIVGLDVRLAIAEHLAREIGPSFEPPQILRDLVAVGRLGRKAGHGFYSW